VKNRAIVAACVVAGLGLSAPSARPEAPAPPAARPYPWLAKADPEQAHARRIAVPPGCERAAAAPGSFAGWLRDLPLKPGRPPVRLFDGREKANQDAHAAVVDLDTGDRDLQQCADAVIRLRARRGTRRGDVAALHFNFTSGDRAEWARWRDGWRPAVVGNRVTWSKSAEPDASYRAFRAYLDKVFQYAGTRSLARELDAVPDPEAVRSGDVFIQGGSPGHAVIVVDVAAERATGRKVVLLAQGYMPAQDMHVLKNPGDAGGGPWFPASFGEELRTPEWTFRRGDLRRFGGEDP
jgi:hypothetical protein